MSKQAFDFLPLFLGESISAYISFLVSSFSNVTKLFGGADNIFTRIWHFLSGGSFIAYLVGYIRIDCINQFKNGPKVPISICPFLSNQYTCKLMFSDQIEGSKIYDYGELFIWDDEDLTFDQIFSQKRSKKSENDKEKSIQYFIKSSNGWILEAISHYSKILDEEEQNYKYEEEKQKKTKSQLYFQREIIIFYET